MTESTRQQMNVNLPSELVRAVKHSAIDSGFTLSAYVEEALRTRLASPTAPPLGMVLQPIVYVTDMARSLAFYRALGFAVRLEGREMKWAELGGPAGVLSLHAVDTLPAVPDSPIGPHPEWPPLQGRVRMCFEAHEPLERIADRLEAGGLERPAINDEAFGRLVWLSDPDGLAIEIVERDRDLTR